MENKYFDFTSFSILLAFVFFANNKDGIDLLDAIIAYIGRL